jgi:hypothetical protein
VEQERFGGCVLFQCGTSPAVICQVPDSRELEIPLAEIIHESGKMASLKKPSATTGKLPKFHWELPKDIS